MEQENKIQVFSILLGRVSTEDQKTVPEQLSELRVEAEKRGEKIVEELSEFHKVSSEELDDDVWTYIKKIPKIRYVIELAKKQHTTNDMIFNKLWVWKWDRLSRDSAFLELMVRILKKYGVACESLKEGTNPLARRIHGVVAQQETEDRRQRVPLGQKREFLKQKIQNRAPFGFYVHKRIKKLIQIPEEILKYQGIIHFFLETKSLYQTAKQFSISIPSLKWMLKNRTYLGEICYKGEWIKGMHEAVITKELFDKVQKVLSKKEKKIPQYLNKIT